MAIVEIEELGKENMNIAQIILAGIALYFGYKLLNHILETPIKVKRVGFENEMFEDFLKLLYIRGYVNRGKHDGRMYVESMGKDRRKLIIRKYDFRNEMGMCMYIPKYEEGIEKKIRSFLKKNGIDEEVWEEWRLEIDGKVVGVDLGDNFEKGSRIIESAINIILKEENLKGRLKVYFKYIAQAEEHYDFLIENFESDPNRIQSIDRPTNWMGLLFSGQRK